MEDRTKRFVKKAEPFSTQPKEVKGKETSFKSLVNRIQSHVEQRKSVLKERPTKDQSMKASMDKLHNYSLQKPSESLHLNDSKFGSLSKSILAKLALKKNVKQDTSCTSKSNTAVKPVQSRDRSTLKERINRLSTLERNIKQTDANSGLIAKPIKTKDKPNSQKSGLSLLQKFQIYQLKNPTMSGSDKSKSSKDAVGSFEVSSHQNQPQDSPSQKFKNGLEKLKQRISKLPGRDDQMNTAASKKSGDIIPLDQQQSITGPNRINSVEAQPVSINIYKKKVDPLQYKRDDQSSLRILKARRSPAHFDAKRNNTIAGASKLRLVEKSKPAE